jgi:hypothetical protein
MCSGACGWPGYVGCAYSVWDSILSSATLNTEKSCPQLGLSLGQENNTGKGCGHKDQQNLSSLYPTWLHRKKGTSCLEELEKSWGYQPQCACAPGVPGPRHHSCSAYQSPSEGEQGRDSI